MANHFNFIILSKHEEQIIDIKTYLNELYLRKSSTEDEPYVMQGSCHDIYYYDSYYMLTGCNIDSGGLDFGFWCKCENRNSLLVDTIYFEENIRKTGIRHYIYENTPTACNPLPKYTNFYIKEFFKFNLLRTLMSELNKYCGLTPDLSKFVAIYFYDRQIWNGISIKHKVNVR